MTSPFPKVVMSVVSLWTEIQFNLREGFIHLTHFLSECLSSATANTFRFRYAWPGNDLHFLLSMSKGTRLRPARALI